MRIVGLPEFSGAVVRSSTAVSATEKASASKQAAAQASQADAPMATSRASAGGSAPIDHDRVSEIRKAIETNSYPLIPTKIADAMIAAGLYGKIAK